MLMNKLSTPPSNIENGYHQDENEMSHYHPQVEPSPMTLIFDTKDLF